MINHQHTKNMIDSYERSFGTNEFLKLCISNIQKILIAEEVTSEQRLDEGIRSEITMDILKRARESKNTADDDLNDNIHCTP